MHVLPIGLVGKVGFGQYGTFRQIHFLKILIFKLTSKIPEKKPNICWFFKNGNVTTMYLGKVPGHCRYSVLSSGWFNQHFSGRKQLFLEKFIFYEDDHDQWPKLQFSSASKTFLLSNTKLVFTYCSINSLRIKVTYFV